MVIRRIWTASPKPRLLTQDSTSVLVLTTPSDIGMASESIGVPDLSNLTMRLLEDQTVC